MNEKLNNNISQHHCSCCRYRWQNETTVLSPTKVYQSSPFGEDKVVCIDCGVKEKKFFMDEFSNGIFVCRQRLFCKDRRSWLLAKQKQ